MLNAHLELVDRAQLLSALIPLILRAQFFVNVWPIFEENMSHSGDTNGDFPRSSDLWALTDACREMVEIAAVVGILFTDLQQEIFECTKEKKKFVTIVGRDIVPTLRLTQFRPHILCLKAIWKKYEAVDASTKSLIKKLEENQCKLTELAEWRRTIDKLINMAGMPINEKKINDPKEFRKELEVATRKGLETKAQFENLKAEWDALKQSATEDINDCLRCAAELLLRVRRHSQVEFEE